MDSFNNRIDGGQRLVVGPERFRGADVVVFWLPAANVPVAVCQSRCASRGMPDRMVWALGWTQGHQPE